MTDSDQFESLKLEAERTNTSINELIRRKLYLQPTPEEILLLRKLKIALKDTPERIYPKMLEVKLKK